MSQEQKLDNLRHSTAHLLAAAVLETWPEAIPTIGPSTDEGFYYDFDFGDTKISIDDFDKIEQKMKQLIKTWKSFDKIDVSEIDAKDHYKNNPYKLELIEEIISRGEPLTFYKSGDFIDLCRGGHVDHPNNRIKHFKLTKLAGAYWRGDEHKAMLTRIYGTAFSKKDELEAYLNQQELAKQRDHRKLGKELDLFTFSDLVGPGLPLFTPKGTLLRNTLDNFVWELRQAKGYQKVEIPHISKKDLFVTSGHWDKFADELFKIQTREGHEFAMKPMNCPHHTQIFARQPHSYKDMPQRYANTTFVYRDEQTGELSGLSRVRAITQDDAHVFCRTSQVQQELDNNWNIIHAFYESVGFELKIRLSLSDPQQPEKYLGDRQTWESAENQLRELVKSKGVEYTEAPGEAAFYGPKIDFMAHDSLGREWQVATSQLDFNMPERFGLFCINEKSEKESIVMIHAAIMGSIERYLSILIEHFGGAFPTWLSPVQTKVLAITDEQNEVAQTIAQKLHENNIRTELDDRSQTLSAKIREAQLQKVPYMLVIGAKEIEKDTITIRTRENNQIMDIKLEDFIKTVTEEISTRQLELTYK